MSAGQRMGSNVTARADPRRARQRGRVAHLRWARHLEWSEKTGKPVPTLCGAKWSVEQAVGPELYVETIGGLMAVPEPRDCKRCLRVFEAYLRRRYASLQRFRSHQGLTITQKSAEWHCRLCLRRDRHGFSRHVAFVITAGGAEAEADGGDGTHRASLTFCRPTRGACSSGLLDRRRRRAASDPLPVEPAVYIVNGLVVGWQSLHRGIDAVRQHHVVGHQPLELGHRAISARSTRSPKPSRRRGPRRHPPRRRRRPRRRCLGRASGYRSRRRSPGRAAPSTTMPVSDGETSKRNLIRAGCHGRRVARTLRF